MVFIFQMTYLLRENNPVWWIRLLEKELLSYLIYIRDVISPKSNFKNSLCAMGLRSTRMYTTVEMQGMRPAIISELSFRPPNIFSFTGMWLRTFPWNDSMGFCGAHFNKSRMEHMWTISIAILWHSPPAQRKNRRLGELGCWSFFARKQKGCETNMFVISFMYFGELPCDQAVLQWYRCFCIEAHFEKKSMTVWIGDVCVLQVNKDIGGPSSHGCNYFSSLFPPTTLWPFLLPLFWHSNWKRKS